MDLGWLEGDPLRVPDEFPRPKYVSSTGMLGPVERIGIIACGKQKRHTSDPVPARDLYIGNVFTARRRYVEATCARWFILSAKHGLVAPDTPLVWYDETWSHLDAATCRHRHLVFAGGVARAFTSGRVRFVPGERGPVGWGKHLVVLGGGHYRAVIELAASRAGWEATVTYPLEGLGLGKQLAWLKANTPPPGARAL